MSRFSLSPRAALVLAGVVVVVALVVVLLGARGSGAGGVATVTGAPVVSDRPSDGPRTPDATSSPAPSVVVHVLGAVHRAGVVTVPGTSRVTDALAAAGGAADDADLARLNLARPVQDGERLYVPRVGEVEVPQELDGGAGRGAGTGSGAGAGGGGGGSGGGSGGAAGVGDVVDLNTADQAALETLPGIGPALAGRILAWRDEHGRFASVDDLLDVSGIGDARLADLRDRVRV
ncbi:ComEA family DNA-binding protein [Curtobacterium sp. Curtsp57]|uniref:ComEA family DNA-binding protein n=1 Tax=Curtobacterium sp. Curtsp57 TaxID=3243047 RepID=UPI0039B671FD